MKTSSPSLPPAERHGRRRGFTLIELMIAMTAGLFLSVAVYMLTRDVSRFFQEEARITDATTSLLLGFERLKADLGRAGFLASPNLIKDPQRCPRPPSVGAASVASLSAGGWANHVPLRSMGLLRIGVGEAALGLSAPSTAFLGANSLTPDSLRLYGNYQNGEQFPIRSVPPAAGGVVILILEPNSGALARIGYQLANPAPSLTIIQNAFPVGRAFRLVNVEGEEQYGIIQQSGLEAGTNFPEIRLNTGGGIALNYRSTQPTCGIRGFGGEFLGNVVNIVEYTFSDTLTQAGSDYAELAPQVDIAGTGETWAKIDLIRRELNPAFGADLNVPALDGTTELIAEYAVDLKFGIHAVSSIAPFQITRYAEGSPVILEYAGDPTQGTAGSINRGPHLIRGVSARLSVRTRSPDRGGNVGAQPGIANGLYRVALTGAGNTFARVRSLTTTVATRNSRNATW